MTIADIHSWLGWVVAGANAIAGTWALIAHWRSSVRGRALWIVTAVAQVLIGIQVIIGVVDMRLNSRDVAGTHLFYGFVALFSVAIIYTYRQQIERWQYVLYGLGGWFLMGLALRSMFIPPLAG